jgi:hypothetical protein
MPWATSDVKGKTKKAKTAKSKRQWRDIANKLKGEGLSDKQAIMRANGVIKRLYGRGDAR